MLGLSRQSPPSWYRDRLREELRERRIAKTPWQKLSETSDVFFSSSRARYDGFPVRKVPPFVTSRHVLVYAYMLTKFTLRWKFYRTAAIICNAPHYDSVREVVNPSKDQKLEEVAMRHQIDPVEFKRVSPTTTSMASSPVETCFRRSLDSAAETQSGGYQSHSQWLDANLSVLCNIRSVIALCSAICRFHTLNSLPRFTKEAAYRKVGCCSRVLQHAEWFGSLSHLLAHKEQGSPEIDRYNQCGRSFILPPSHLTLATSNNEISHRSSN